MNEILDLHSRGGQAWGRQMPKSLHTLGCGSFGSDVCWYVPIYGSNIMQVWNTVRSMLLLLHILQELVGHIPLYPSIKLENR